MIRTKGFIPGVPPLKPAAFKYWLRQIIVRELRRSKLLRLLKLFNIIVCEQIIELTADQAEAYFSNQAGVKFVSFQSCDLIQPGTCYGDAQADCLREVRHANSEVIFLEVRNTDFSFRNRYLFNPRFDVLTEARTLVMSCSAALTMTTTVTVD